MNDLRKKSEADSLPEASCAVKHEWTRRVEAEYGSAAVTQELVLWLMRLAAPRELIDDGLRIVSDELDHAQLSADVCRAAGDCEAPRIVRDRLSAGGRPELSLELNAIGACVRFFCLGETVAVPLFKELRSQCVQPTARAALDRILRDEVRHRQFGWDLLDYFVDTLPGAREHAQRVVGPYLQQLTHGYTGGPEGDEITSVERAWGLMPQTLYRRILDDTVMREYVPRFGELGIKISPNDMGNRRYSSND